MGLVRLAAILVCALAAAAAEALTVTVHDRAGAVADVVVSLEPADGTLAPVAGTATIDQVDKRFVPRISVVRTGTSISFPNSDRVRHEVYSFSPTKTFTLKLYAGRSAPPVVFERSGLVVLGCNIHDSMVGFVAIVDTPYFGRTDAQGQVTLSAPPGRYRLRIWHPDLDRPVPLQALSLAADAKPLAVEISRAQFPGTVAPWTE